MSSDSAMDWVDPVGSYVANNADSIGGAINDYGDDLAAWTKTSLDRAPDTLDPFFVPELGSPLSKNEGWWSPTGNFDGGTWGEGLRENGMSNGTLAANSDVQEVGDFVAPKVASYFFGPWVNGLVGEGLGVVGGALSEGSGDAASYGAGSMWENSVAGGYGAGAYETGSLGSGMGANALGGASQSATDSAYGAGGWEQQVADGYNPGYSASGSLDLGASTGTGSLWESAVGDGMDTGYNPTTTSLGGEAPSNNWSYDDASLGSPSAYDTGSTANMNSASQSNVAGLTPTGSEYTATTDPNLTTGTTANTSTGPSLDSGAGAGATSTVNTQLDNGGGTGSMWEDAVKAGYGDAATYNYNPAAQNPSLWDKLVGGVSDAYMKNPVGNTIKLGGALSSYLNSQDAAAAYKQAMAATDPFGSQRSQYQNLLAQSYLDPTSIYNSKEYQSLQNLFLKDLRAKDAAAGRNSQYASRSTQAQNYFNTYLNNYRAGLQNAAGTTIAPGTNYSQLAMNSAQQSKNAYDSLFGGLNTIFGNPSTSEGSISMDKLKTLLS